MAQKQYISKDKLLSVGFTEIEKNYFALKQEVYSVKKRGKKLQVMKEVLLDDFSRLVAQKGFVLDSNGNISLFVRY